MEGDQEMKEENCIFLNILPKRDQAGIAEPDRIAENLKTPNAEKHWIRGMTLQICELSEKSFQSAVK